MLGTGNWMIIQLRSYLFHNLVGTGGLFVKMR